eukprot:7644058-Pyramimonas_sp.AAC.1
MAAFLLVFGITGARPEAASPPPWGTTTAPPGHNHWPGPVPMGARAQSPRANGSMSTVTTSQWE